MLLVIGAESAQAIFGGIVVSQQDRRFDAVGATIYDTQLTPGTCPNGTCHSTGGTATLIAPDMILTACHVVAHCYAGDPPPPPISIRFRVNPDGSFGQVQQGDPETSDLGWESFYHVRVVEWWFPSTGYVEGIADLALGRLEHCVTHIKPIPVRFVFTAGQSPPGTPLGELGIGTPIKIAGWGHEADCAGSLEWQHRLKMCSNFTVAPVFSVLWTQWWNEGCPFPPGADGVPILYDSGAPVIVESPCGKLELVAVVKDVPIGTVLGPFLDDAEFPVPIYVDSCPADLNADRNVNGLDLAVLLGAWGLQCPGDLDDNGVVNGVDLAVLLGAWGRCEVLCDSPVPPPESGATSASSAESSSMEDDVDSFYDWALQATVDELLDWLMTGCWGAESQ